jgi:DNA invertase Pin-like site-specific DNA recombinase
MRVALYARVSKDEQHTEVQVEALVPWVESLGYEVSIVHAEANAEAISGAKRERPELERLMEGARRGEVDAVAVVKLDRLARSLGHLIEIASELEGLGVALLVKDQRLDTSTASGKLLFHVLGAVAEFERDLISERTKAGLEHARGQGAVLGRPRRGDFDLEEARAMHERGFGVSWISRALGVPRTTLRAALLR